MRSPRGSTYAQRRMLLTRTFAQRRMMLIALAGAFVLCTFLALPQGRAFASTLLLFFRGQSIQPYSTTYAGLVNAYQTLEELEKLGTLQGKPPTVLSPASSLSSASSTAGFTPAQPSSLPSGFTGTPSSIKALGPSTVTLTLQKATADAYFKSIGSTQTMPSLYDGEQIVVNFPGVTVLEYTGKTGGEAYVGEAGQLLVQISGNATAAQLRTWLLQLPGLSTSTANALQNINNWQYDIPLGIPTDKAGFTSTTVGGTYGGSGVIVNDNTGIFSAVLWQRSSGTLTLGVGGRGLTAQQVQSIAGSLH
jgi:hypothetical protein